MKTIRKITTVLLIAALISCSCIPAFGASYSEAAAQDVVMALGIMTGYSDGTKDLRLDKNLTRAQLAKMLSAASSFREGLSENGLGYALYKDVPGNHWAGEYIKLAIEQGWMSGYSDGSFKPDNTVRLEDACSALLKLLGYTTVTLSGSYPMAQLNKASQLGILDGVKSVKGEFLTRRDCMYMFCSALSARTYSGQTYANLLGYTVSNGQVNYNAVVLDRMEGPFIAGAGDVLPSAIANIYLNGKLRSGSGSYALSENDVYYTNESMQTAWVFNEKVSGKLSALSPSESSPAAAVVAGRSYSLGTADASAALSSLGGSKIGTTVTLLLGMDGVAVGVLSGSSVNAEYTGFVAASAKGAGDDAELVATLSLLCSDGQVRSFELDRPSTFKPGQLVNVSVSGDKITAKSLNTKSLSGTVSRSGRALDDYDFAEDIKIIDSNGSGGGAVIEPEKLAGAELMGSQVRYYIQNIKGEIEELFLEKATDVNWIFGLMISADSLTLPGSISSSYTAIVNGVPRLFSFSGVAYSVDKGGFGYIADASGTPVTMKQLTTRSLTSLNGSSARAGNIRLDIADNVQVYLKDGDSYYLTDIDNVSVQRHRLIAWYDDFGIAGGGLVRVLIADPLQ